MRHRLIVGAHGNHPEPKGAARMAPWEKGEEHPPLTAKQVQVLEMVAAGKTSFDIGRELSLSPHTVIAHKRAIRERLRARTIPAAVAVAIRNGWIT